jgi:tetratricopeptide (TPR) repeat protein
MFFDQASAAEVRAAADPSDAGSHWRREKLKDLVWRAKCLHVHDRPEFAEAIEQLKALTAQVEHIAHAQSQPTYKTPWWMDGEYDDKRAEEHNDRGVASQKQKKHDAAFDEFTEAIRLAPSRAVYHANRAAVALKLGRDACAASDALNACERDPNHVAAHVRAATAILRVGGADPEESLRLFERALVLDPGNVAASRGKADASAAAGAARAERTAQTERARRGERDPLPPPADWPTRAEAADALLAAEEVARLNPRMEGPITAHCEALVLCGRLDRAATTTAQLDADSADRAYLAAEIAWRRSGLAAVDDALARLAAVASPPRKIVELGSRLARLKELADRGEADVEDGRFESAERAFTAALQLRDQRRLWGPGSAAGGEPYPNRCRADLLRARALARLDGFGYDREGAEGGAERDDDDDDDRCFDPEADLEECVAIDPGDVEAWRILADVSRHGGDVERTFLRLRKAQASAPHDAKIAREVFAAARAVKAEADGGTYEGRSIGGQSAMDRRPGSFYKILGVNASATAKQIRRGYRRAAGKWHPDKWQHEGGDALARAEAEFRRVSAAYEALGNPSRRRAYDSDPARFEASL